MPDLYHNTIFFSLLLVLTNGCLHKNDTKENPDIDSLPVRDSVSKSIKLDNLQLETADTIEAYASMTKSIETKNVLPYELVNFAESLVGIPYKYASIDPKEGFDCSGFITYVFNHFNIQVPRSSIDFTNVGKEIPVSECKRGDLVLFTGTDSTIQIVGHMGIVTSKDNDQVNFIHSSSGKANGVVITPLERYYAGRFVKVIRIFQ